MFEVSGIGGVHVSAGIVENLMKFSENEPGYLRFGLVSSYSFSN